MTRTTTTELDRLEGIEFARSRRLGSHVTVLVFQPHALEGRARLRRRRSVSTLEDLAAFLRQHLRCYDRVIEDLLDRRVVTVATEVDPAGARAMQRRLERRLAESGRSVRTGVVTFPEDGLLLAQLLEHAESRLIARPAERNGTDPTSATPR